MDGDTIQYKPSMAYLSKSEKKLYGANGNVIWEENPALSLEPFKGPVETVSVSLTRTVNIHNFESVQIFVSRSMPVVPGGDNVDAAYQTCLSWIGVKINEQIRKVVDFRDKRNVAANNEQNQQQQKKFTNSISY